MSISKEPLPTSEDPEVETAAKRAALEADVAKSANRVMNHMNRDHEDSLVAYVLAFATGVEGTDPLLDKEEALLKNIQRGRLTITSVELTQVDADGFLLQIKASESPSSEVLVLSNVRVPYHEPIQSARDLHHTAVAMHTMAYDQLGIWYKTTSGFYAKKLKQSAYQSYKALQKSETPQKLYEKAAESKVTLATGAVALVAATVASQYLRGRSA